MSPIFLYFHILRCNKINSFYLPTIKAKKKPQEMYVTVHMLLV